MKKINLRHVLFIPLLLIFASTYSQEKAAMSAADRAAKMTDWMKSTLQLTDSQLSQVQAINEKYANKKDDLMKNTTQSKKDKMDAMKADESARDEELKGVLTPDQFKTYQAKKDEMKKNMKEKMKEKKAPTK
jgi:hypothetical protein